MSWQPLVVNQRRRSDDYEMYLIFRERDKKLFSRRKGGAKMTNDLRGALTPAAYSFLCRGAGVDPADPQGRIRVGAAADPTRPGVFAILNDPEGIICSKSSGREFSGHRLRSVFGDHVPDGGYRIPLVAEGEVLTFIWPPEDMRKVIIPRNVIRATTPTR